VVSEILSGKRSLNLEQIKKASSRFHVSLNNLLFKKRRNADVVIGLLINKVEFNLDIHADTQI